MATRSLSAPSSPIALQALFAAPARLLAGLALLRDCYRDALAMAHDAQRRGIFVE
jgi:hypothetical protein